MDGNFARVGAGKFLMEIANGKKMSESTDLPRACVCYSRQSLTAIFEGASLRSVRILTNSCPKVRQLRLRKLLFLGTSGIAWQRLANQKHLPSVRLREATKTAIPTECKSVDRLSTLCIQNPLDSWVNAFI
jgi:hypothetical protein